MIGAAVAYKIGADQKERYREMAHEELDKWIDGQLSVFDEDKEPTLEELSELFAETRHKFLGKCLEKLIENKYEPYIKQEYAACPKCATVNKKRLDSAKETITLHGEMKLTRPWFYCKGCGLGYSPLDEVLKLSRKKYQFDIQKKSVKLTSEVPFQKGSELFEDLTGHKLSDHFMHETFEMVGEAATLSDIIPSKEEIKEKIKEISTGTWRPILVVASDGAHLPTRTKAGRKEKRGKGIWKEAKGFRIYLLSEKSITQVASWHQIQDESQFGEDLALVASRIPQKSVRIALLGDGADWLWKHMTSCFPYGREVLDYYHCMEHIYKVGKIQYGEKSLAGVQWVESIICRLYLGEVDNVIDCLGLMSPTDNEAAEEIRKLIGYLNNNRDRIHYRSDRNGGYPIGSGGIESANKYICHTRMKRSGAWWVKETGNEMLRIRCAIYNGTYDKVFDRYRQSKMLY